MKGKLCCVLAAVMAWALFLCPAVAKEEQRPATEQEIRAIFEAFLTEDRGLPPGAVEDSEITLAYDEAQEGWSATCAIDLEAVTADYAEWVENYDGNVGLTWNLMSATFDKYGVLDFSHPQLVDHEPPPDFPVSQEEAVEQALAVVGRQYSLGQQQLDALDARVMLRMPKKAEDPDYYEYQIEFFADDLSEQGARIWRYRANVDTGTGQVLSVVHKDDPDTYFAPARE